MQGGQHEGRSWALGKREAGDYDKIIISISSSSPSLSYFYPCKQQQPLDWSQNIIKIRNFSKSLKIQLQLCNSDSSAILWEVWTGFSISKSKHSGPVARQQKQRAAAYALWPTKSITDRGTDGASAAPGGTPGREGAGEGQGTGQPGQRREVGRGRVAVCMCFYSLWIFVRMPGGNGISLKPPGLRCPPTKLKSSLGCVCENISCARL